jgi:acyl-CoA synthetase (AMP-forming)/AMP-acid ligase II
MSSNLALERARKISRAHSDALLAKPNVIGVGLGYLAGSPTELTLVVMVDRKVPLSALAEDEIVPSEIEGLPVEVREVGEVSAQGEVGKQKD